MTAADFTCTLTQSGSVPEASEVGVSTQVLPSSEVASMDSFETVAIVSETGASADPTDSPSKSGSRSASGSAGPSASGSGAPAAQSTGFAPAGPLPTGVMAFAGGAVGVLAAALAL